MSSTAPQIRDMKRSSVRDIIVDCGENTAAQKTGALAAGDTVASCTVSIKNRPPGAVQADDPTFGSVTVPANTLSDDINDRLWSEGEAVKVRITTGATQAYGKYELQFNVTTTNGEQFPVFVFLVVD